MRHSLAIPVVLVMISAGCFGQSSCPRVVPSSIQLYLPASLPPGPHPFVSDEASVWVFCDTAPPGGLPFEVSVSGSTLMSAVASDPMRTASDTTYLWPNLQISVLSFAITPPLGTQQATVRIRSGAGEIALPVSVTITDAPFIHASDTTLLFRIPGDSSFQRLSFWLPNAQTRMPVTASANSQWLSLNPGGGAGYTDLDVQVNPANLSNGDYVGFVTLTSPDAVNSPLQVPVRMTLVPLSMWSQPQSLSFSQPAGGPVPAAQTLNILPSGAPVSFTIASDTAWLSASPMSGTTPAQISVSVNGAGLAPGTYHANLTASAAAATTLVVPVTLTIDPENTLTLKPNDFNFFYWPGIATFDQVNQADMEITSGRPLKWTAVKSPENWFYFANYTTSGTTPYRFVIGVAWGSLNTSGPVPPGTFSGTITISSAEASNSPQTATLHGYSLPAAPVNISQTTISFQSLGSDPTPVTVSVTSPDPANFIVAVPSGNSWLTISPSGAVTPATLTFGAKTAGLQSGNYADTVALYVQQSNGPPIPMHINVNLSVLRR